MMLVIDVDPEVERKLGDDARRHGVSIEDRARALLERSLEGRGERPFYEQAAPEEWHRAFHELVADLQGLVAAPVIPDEALRRQHLYDDRGLWSTTVFALFRLPRPRPGPPRGGPAFRARGSAAWYNVTLLPYAAEAGRSRPAPAIGGSSWQQRSWRSASPSWNTKLRA